MLRHIRKSLILITISILILSNGAGCQPTEGQPGSIKLPPGFQIEVFADDVPGARSMALGSKGTLFVGTRDKGTVYAILDTNNDFKADKVIKIAEGLNMPNGVAFKDGSLYVAEVSRIIRFDNIEENLNNPPKPVVIKDDYPTEESHGWKFIRFGPDGKLYVPVGAPCNNCLSTDSQYASITRINQDGSDFEIIARGVRNTVGFDWHPQTKELWFTDNGRDMLGDNVPPDELNKAPQKGLHFGYPHFHGNDLRDPQYGEGKNPGDYVRPEQLLGPHVAALGMRFYTGKMFPPEYRGHIFIAEHGSWNRSEKIGYRVMLVKLQNNKAVSYEPFAHGWLNSASVSGRPVDVQELPDGSMLVSDDYGGVIYRVTYTE